VSCAVVLQRVRLTSSVRRESTLVKVADAWAWYHKTISKIPNFLLLALSGFLANLAIGFVSLLLHRRASAERGRRADLAPLQFHKPDSSDKKA
jgi:hypothetical protein